MDYDTKDFFTEVEDDSVGGFVVIETSEARGYRMAEKWDADKSPESSATGEHWHTYWISEQALQDRLAADKCKHVKRVSDKQFDGILNLAGVTRATLA